MTCGTLSSSTGCLTHVYSSSVVQAAAQALAEKDLVKVVMQIQSNSQKRFALDWFPNNVLVFISHVHEHALSA
jgi:hypothetical protein